MGAPGSASRAAAGMARFDGDDAAAWIRRALRVVRTVIGAPDYERYVDHMHDHHPGCDVVSRDEFMRQRLENRYSRPGSRCC